MKAWPHLKRRLTHEFYVALIVSFSFVAVAGSYILSDTNQIDAATFYTPDAIASDCSVNVSPALSSWLAGVPDGANIQFKSGGCYRIDQTIILAGRNNLTIDGQGATFKTDDPTGDGSPLATPSKAARTRSQWRLGSTTNIIMKNMTIKGANPNAGQGDAAYREALEAQNGIDIMGAANTEVSNVTITDVYGDFVYLGRSDAKGWVDGVRIHNSHFERNGRQAIAIIAARNVRIDANYIGDTRRTTFDLEPNSELWGSDNVVIDNNTIGPGRLLMISSGGLGQINRLTITNNRFERAATMSFRGGTGRLSSLIIDNNTQTTPYDSSQGTMIGASNIDGLSFKNNTILFAPKKNMSALRVSSSTAVTATGNTLINGVGVAVFPPDSPSQILQLCDNRYSVSGAFNLPSICPPAGTPIVPISSTDPKITVPSSGPNTTPSTVAARPSDSPNATTETTGSDRVAGSGSATVAPTRSSSPVTIALDSNTSPSRRVAAVGTLYAGILAGLAIGTFAVVRVLRLTSFYRVRHQLHQGALIHFEGPAVVSPHHKR